jgi:hypothetical protein
MFATAVIWFLQLQGGGGWRHDDPAAAGVLNKELTSFYTEIFLPV